jgi:hypothetical protein
VAAAGLQVITAWPSDHSHTPSRNHVLVWQIGQYCTVSTAIHPAPRHSLRIASATLGVVAMKYRCLRPHTQTLDRYGIFAPQFL